MKFLFELLPIILFFIAYKFKNIFFATGIAILVSFIQIVYYLLRKKKVELTMWISLGILIVFGGSTILFHNELYIKWKPSILYWIFSLILLGAKIFWKKNIIKKMLEKQIELPEKVWTRLNTCWGIFFLALGFVNILVAYNFSTDIWVNFKLFGLMGVMIVFVIIQSLFLMPYIDKD